MAKFPVNSNVLLVVFIILHSSSLGGGEPANSGLISQVCSEVRFPARCWKELNSDPRVRGATLADLGRISISLAYSTADAASQMVSRWGQSMSNPMTRAAYQTCLECYKNVAHSLNESGRALFSGDYASMKFHALAALQEPDTCDGGFKKAMSFTARQLILANQRFSDLCNVVLVISKRLAGTTDYF